MYSRTNLNLLLYKKESDVCDSDNEAGDVNENISTISPVNSDTVVII